MYSQADATTKSSGKQKQNVPLRTDAARIVISTEDVKLILNIWEEILLIEKPLTGQIY